MKESGDNTHLLPDERGGRLDVVVVEKDELVRDLLEAEDHAGCVRVGIDWGVSSSIDPDRRH